jgi:hypothetical protein
MAKIASRKTCGALKDRLLIGTGTVSRGQGNEIEFGKFKCVEGYKSIDSVIVKAEWHKAYKDDKGKIVKRQGEERPIKDGENR